MVVDLPAPLRPKNPKAPPISTLRLIRSTAIVSLYDFERLDVAMQSMVWYVARAI